MSIPSTTNIGITFADYVTEAKNWASSQLTNLKNYSPSLTARVSQVASAVFHKYSLLSYGALATLTVIRNSFNEDLFLKTTTDDQNKLITVRRDSFKDFKDLKFKFDLKKVALPALVAIASFVAAYKAS